MADYTIQIIVEPPAHSAKNPSGLYELGDIVGIHPRITESASLTGRLGFIHVTGVPDIVSLEGLRAEMVRPQEAYITVDAPEMVKKALWSGSIPAVNLSELQTTKETALDWSVVQNIYSRKGSGITGAQVFAEFLAGQQA